MYNCNPSASDKDHDKCTKSFESDTGCDSTNLEAGSGTGSAECNSDSDCKSPRKCQNHECIGNPGEPILKKCQSDSDCQSKETCYDLTGGQKKCVPSKFAR